jgi:hypothetical protein
MLIPHLDDELLPRLYKLGFEAGALPHLGPGPLLPYSELNGKEASAVRVRQKALQKLRLRVPACIAMAAPAPRPTELYAPGSSSLRSRPPPLTVALLVEADSGPVIGLVEVRAEGA